MVCIVFTFNYFYVPLNHTLSVERKCLEISFSSEHPVILSFHLQPDLTINHHAENTLQSFGRWAERRNEINQSNDDKPAYDFAILMTKYVPFTKSNPLLFSLTLFVPGFWELAKPYAP